MTAAATFEDRPLAASVHAAQRTGAAVGYMPQIDALRAFAITGVLVCHYLEWRVPYVAIVDWGGMGVRLFFVISGFLITSILLKAREMRDGDSGLGSVAGKFYARRILRIFPVFYLALALSATLPIVRETILWHVSYLSNFWLARHGFIFPLTPLWSLAVEEQFYLIWPWFILCFPRRWLLGGCLATVGFGFCYRFVVVKLGGWLWGPWMMPGCMDTLGVGALLAIMKWERKCTEQHIRFLTSRLALIGLTVFSAGTILDHLEVRNWGLIGITNDLWLAMIFVWLVNRASAGFSGIGRQILCFGPLRYIGKISYGIYLYHLFLTAWVERFCEWMHWSSPSVAGAPASLNAWECFALYSALSVAVASVSWHFFERPILGLKRYFEYRDETVHPSPVLIASTL